MASTKYILAEQIILRLQGGYMDANSAVQREDVYKAIEQKINADFKLQHFSQTLASGETIPDNLAIATYEEVAVVSLGNGKSYSTLPVTPITLTKNMGIHLVYNPAKPDNMFIPLQRGQLALLRADQLLNDLMGSIGYEPKNKQIIYTKDLVSLGISTVTMELIVFDMSQYSDTDNLPLPADYEEKIITELVQQFAVVKPESGLVNNFSQAQNQ